MVSAPEPPDPYETAQAQSAMNKETAIAQYGLAATNQITPTGTLTYEQTGMWPDETPQYTSTQTLSPEQQRLLDIGERTATTLGQTAQQQARQVQSTLATPVDLSNSATEAYLFDLGQAQLDPYYDEQQAQLETQLANQGLSTGSEAYGNEMQAFHDAEADAYNELLLTGHTTAVNDILTERNQPLQELSALMTGSQVSQPSYVTTPQPGVEGVDYTGLVNQQYQAESDQYNAMMGGLFSIPTTLLGGWATSGFA